MNDEINLRYSTLMKRRLTSSLSQPEIRNVSVDPKNILTVVATGLSNVERLAEILCLLYVQ